MAYTTSNPPTSGFSEPVVFSPISMLATTIKAASEAVPGIKVTLASC